MPRKERPREFYHTKPDMAQDLLCMLDLPKIDSILDAGSGDLVWYNALKAQGYANIHECDIERGQDFYAHTPEYDDYDWIVGNPPFHESWKFFEHASRLVNKGIAFLINNQALNSWTPKRLALFAERGLFLRHIRVVIDKRWFGRYYFMVFVKESDPGFISWETEQYI